MMFYYKTLQTSAEKPLTIEADLYKSKDGAEEYKFHFQVEGAQHPHDPQCLTGLINDTNKNPALLPTLHLLQEKLSEYVREAAISAGINNQNVQKNTDLNNIPTRAKIESAVIPTAGGFSTLLVFNPAMPHLRPANFQPVAKDKLIKFYNTILDKLEALEPEIKKTIENNKHLQQIHDIRAESFHRDTCLGLRTTTFNNLQKSKRLIIFLPSMN